ncbi:MAG: transposase [Halopseudomonas aestusnigri]
MNAILKDLDDQFSESLNKGLIQTNVQSAVDVKNHLIVAHEVTNIGNDRRQLSNMGKQAKAAMKIDMLKVIADKGYYKGEEILACEETNITAFVPKCLTSGNKAKGLFDKSDFIYNAKEDVYECPAGEKAPYRFSHQEKGRIIKRYWSSACSNCSLKSQCTTGKYRRISRWEHEDVLDAMEKHLQSEPDIMNVRKSTVEHPFGTIKSWMGHTHFQMRTLEKVSTEMSLHVLSYNLKRAIKIVGAKPLMMAMRA